MTKWLVERDHLGKHFSVQGSGKADPSNDEFDRVYSSRGDAVAAFHSLRMKYKWLSEIGVYELGGERTVGWVSYLWNDNPLYGDPPKQQGKGVPFDDVYEMVSYVPAAMPIS